MTPFQSRWGHSLALALPWLLSSCMSYEPAHMPNESSISLENGVLISPDCSSMVDKSHFKNDTLQRIPRPSVAFGCATYNNLAKMIARPQDLVAPRGYSGQSGANAATAAQRYYDNKLTPFIDNSTSNASPTNSGSSAGSK